MAHDPQIEGNPTTEAKDLYPATMLSVSEDTQVVPHGHYASSPDPSCIGSGGPDPSATCVVLRVYLPLTAQVQAVQAIAKERGASAWVLCGPEQGIGWCKFSGNYQETTTPTNKVVNWLFKNWSHNRDREAKITVTFTQ